MAVIKQQAAAGAPGRGLFTIRRWRTALAYLAAIATLGLIWTVATLFLPPYLLPGIPATVVRWGELVGTPDFLGGLRSSFYRLGVGYPLACLLGAALGLLAGLFRSFALYLRGLISILQSVPPITWVPFLAILFGFGDIPIISVITLASFFPMALSVMNGTEGISRTHVEVARVMGASRRQLLQKVYLPETMPSVITGAQVAFGNAWRSLIAAEMVGGASSGLGWSISLAGETADMAGVLVGIIVVGGSAALIDHFVLEQIKRYLLRWRNTVGGEAA
ncbi:MAG: ABC transporter permease [Bacillota bacterium]